MSATTELLAREIIGLDRAIADAASGHRWLEAHDLDTVREQLGDMRYSILRRERAERMECVA